MQNSQAKRRNRDTVRRAALRRAEGMESGQGGPLTAEAAASLSSAYALADLVRALTGDAS
jgi:hypothetical protein